MKESLLPTSSPTPTTTTNKSRYKLYALLAILLLASWSMLTGTVTVTLKSSPSSAASDPAADHDILEVEEREKVVRKMWDVYSHNREVRLPRFWLEAFEAAYEELVDDELRTREGAISEIARMSMRKILDLDKNTADEKKKSGKANVKLSSMTG